MAAMLKDFTIWSLSAGSLLCYPTFLPFHSSLVSWQEVTGQPPSLLCPPRQHARIMFSGTRGSAGLLAGTTHSSIPPSSLCLGLEDGQRDRTTENIICQYCYLCSVTLGFVGGAWYPCAGNMALPRQQACLSLGLGMQI